MFTSWRMRFFSNNFSLNYEERAQINNYTIRIYVHTSFHVLGEIVDTNTSRGNQRNLKTYSAQKKVLLINLFMTDFSIDSYLPNLKFAFLTIFSLEHTYTVHSKSMRFFETIWFLIICRRAYIGNDHKTYYYAHYLFHLWDTLDKTITATFGAKAGYKCVSAYMIMVIMFNLEPLRDLKCLKFVQRTALGVCPR